MPSDRPGTALMIPCSSLPNRIPSLFIAGCLAITCAPAAAQIPQFLETPPISYLETPPDDAVTKLQRRMDAGDVRLTFDKQHGYLKSDLEHLHVSAASQALVFSKTSFQSSRISADAPRAIYFGDDVYIGWVNGGDMEFSVVDPKLGTNFYVLRQQEAAKPKFSHRTQECLQCHSSALTLAVPGHMVRSVYVRPDGEPDYEAGTFLTDSTSPFKQRWGGWYVTGTHGSQRHLGNLQLAEGEKPADLNLDKGANVTDLGARFETSAYLTPHSDIVALMVLEHQTALHNRLTRASFLTRMALYEDRTHPDEDRSAATERTMRDSADALVQQLLFSGEMRLTDPIAGTSGFQKQFAARGPRDSQGRSLRDFDLKTRLFKHPCSYLIYSRAFDSLPQPLKQVVYRRLWNVLTAAETDDDFSHLTATDRKAILGILRETKQNLPAYWSLQSGQTATNSQ